MRRILGIVCAVVVLLSLSTQGVVAVDEIVTVTATVGDSITPSVPILVSPTDGATITTTLPTFIWEPSTDAQGIAKYQLWLDGSLLFDNIPTGNTTNSSYTLVLEDGEYKLTVKTSLSQGDHTWRIVAFDTNANSATSATWDFRVDTTAPVTTITAIGDVTTSITSSDAGSVPSSPLQVPDNQPAIVGTSENGATLTLTLTIPGQGTQVLSTTVSGSTYSFQLGVLPTNTVISFTLVSQDIFGNSSTISNVQFLIQPLVIVIPTPVPPTPSPTPEGATPAPGETPLPSPTPVTIEIPRPEEVIEQITQPPEEKRPAVIDQLIAAVPLIQDIITNPVVETVSQALPVLTVVAPVAVAVATATQTGSSFLYPLIELLTKILQALGLIPKRKPHGVVFDSESGAAVPFATVNILRSSLTEIFDSVVSDEYGVYNSITLAKGEYRLDVVQTEYTFPTHKERSRFASIFDFYKGEPFVITDENAEQFFLIPMDAKDPTTKPASVDRQSWRRIITPILTRISGKLFAPMAVLSFIMTLFFPTILNILICALYIVLFIWYYYDRSKKPLLSLRFVDEHGAPVPGVVARITMQQTNTLVAVRITDTQGGLGLRLPPGEYAMTATKAGTYLCQNDQPLDLAFLRLQTSQQLTFLMKDTASLFQTATPTEPIIAPAAGSPTV